MKKTFFIFSISEILFCFLGLSSSPAQNISGPLSGVLGPGTYTVVGSISVLYGQSLNIQSGTTFLFTGDYDFDIYGYLHAAGTETDSIIFRRDSGIPWNGIDFNSIASDSSILEYCLITGSDGCGLYIYDACPTISHCYITGNTAGTG